MKALKYSRQRESIKASLMNRHDHPTADALYASIREEFPNISLGTVYRNLNQLAENGIIRRIDGLDGSVHFDHNLCKHYHFICTKCNKVYDVAYDIAPDLADKVLAETGLFVESFDISLKGICPNCKKNN